jgi:HTH-type transcriptional regulator/antitoxin MqsA
MTVNNPILCPVCDSNSLRATRYSDQFVHGGTKILVEDLEKYDCSECHSDPILPDQVRRNQVKIADAKRRADGLLTSDMIRSYRVRLGLSQSAAANVFGGGDNAFSKYERGEVIQSFQMDRLLRLALDLPSAMSQLAHYDGYTAANTHFIKNDGTLRWQAGGGLVHPALVLPILKKTGG